MTSRTNPTTTSTTYMLYYYPIGVYGMGGYYRRSYASTKSKKFQKFPFSAILDMATRTCFSLLPRNAAALRGAGAPPGVHHCAPMYTNVH